jgi:hypothetical protein
MDQAMQVLTSRGTVNWYTPSEVIELVRAVLGRIDLDPASDELPQAWINAKQQFTVCGLSRPWGGKIFLNPPFDNSAVWVAKLIAEYESLNVSEAILLVNSNLGYKWYENLWISYPVCCARERIRFIKADGTQGGQAKRGQTFVYFGTNVERFSEVFSSIGRVILPAS